MGKQKYVSDKALAEALAQRVQDLPDNWLACRDMKHAWEVEDAEDDYHVSKSKGSHITELRRILTCLRCGTKRHERYHPGKWGLEKVGQHYAYPVADDGSEYQLHGMPRGVKPSFIIQGEQYRRVMERLAASQKKSNLKVV